MNNAKHDSISSDPTSYVAWAILIWFTGIFASWTLLHSIATFGHMSWQTTKIASAPIFFAISILAVPVTRNVFREFIQSNTDEFTTYGLPIKAVFAVFALAGALYFLPTYTAKFILSGAVFLICFFSNRIKPLHQESPMQKAELKISLEMIIFFLLVAVTVAFVLCGYRSDYDDAEFIQTALQTILYPERAPLTFDISMGHYVDHFRFAPYRFSSYETFVALLSELLSFKIMTVYYLLLPAVGGVICMCAAHLLTRYFLSRQMALMALFIFLLLLLAWGETHIAYGNRVLVRLYQGKGWLISFGTPMMVLCGMLLMRRGNMAVWLCYVASSIAAVGVSSSGLVVSCGVVLMLTPLAFVPYVKTTAIRLILLGTGAIYPLVCGIILLLKFHGAGATAASSTLLPINASLGETARESLALALLALSACFYNGGRRRRELAILCGSILFLIMNPWGSEIISRFSASNMRWRFAWAAPIPIVLSILFTLFFEKGRKGKKGQNWHRLSLIAGAFLLAAFLTLAPWVTKTGNNDFHFAAPAWKTPPEYDEVTEIARLLPSDIGNTVLLAPSRQGTWLTVTSPGLHLIMPGHGYIGTAHNLMPQEELQSRLELLAWLDYGTPIGRDRLQQLLMRFEVGYIVCPKSDRAEAIFGEVNDLDAFRTVQVFSTENFVVLSLYLVSH